MDGRYRADIDGLRAIAVALVIVFHAFPNRLPGGFVGVDVFFVISGFLISGIIVNGLEASSFSFIDFYARRVRRLFPALAIVLIVTLTMGWMYSFPIEYKTLNKNVIFSLLFVSNFYLSQIKYDNYFNAVLSQDNPLTHLWSLGVEEQFYLIWPISLVALAFTKINKVYIICVLAIISFLLNIIYVKINVSEAFYLPFTRFWELLIGALLAEIHGRTPFVGWIAKPRCAHMVSAAGLVLLISSASMLHFDRPYPGWWGLAPTLGTALIISAGAKGVVNRVLASRLPVYIGLISYPLYLWHWPMLVFANGFLKDTLFAVLHFHTETQTTKLVMASLAIAGSFVAAVLTYHYCERPLQRQPLRRVATAMLTSMVAIGGVSLLLLITPISLLRFSPASLFVIKQAEQERSDVRDRLRADRCLLVDIGPEGFKSECRARLDPTVFLWGDSYAAHLYSGLNDLIPGHISQFTASACAPILGLHEKERPHCFDVNNYAMDEIARERPKILVIAANWPSYAGVNNPFAGLDATIAKVRPSVGKIIFIGPVPVFIVGQAELWVRHRQDFLPVEDEFPDLVSTDKRLHSLMDTLSISYISPVAEFCRDPGCMAFVPPARSHVLFALDNGHLTAAGSDFYAQKLIWPLLDLPMPIKQ